MRLKLGDYTLEGPNAAVEVVREMEFMWNGQCLGMVERWTIRPLAEEVRRQPSAAIPQDTENRG